MNMLVCSVDLFDAGRPVLVMELPFAPYRPRHPLLRHVQISLEKVLTEINQLEIDDAISV